MPAVTSGWAGRSNGWRYLAQRIDGSGTPGVFLHNELPLSSVRLTDVLSGPPQFTATITPVLRQLRGSDGLPVLTPWRTAIHAEADGVIQGSFILDSQGFNGPDWNLDCTGYVSMMKGRAWPNVDKFRQVEPLDVVRQIWNTIQLYENSNLNVIVDPSTRTGQKLGAPETILVPTTTGSDVGAADAGLDDEPYTLAWYETHDLAAEIDSLATDFGFEYHERHAWNSQQTDVLHYLDFAYPAWGRRREHLRFVYGENILTQPELAEGGDDYANHVMVLGAGEGSAMIRGDARIRDGRVRRMAVVSDTSITTNSRAQRAARLEVMRRSQITTLDSVVIKNTAQAPLGSFGVGDEIRVQVDTDWKPLDAWFRITSMTIDPDTTNYITVSLVRSDWV